MQEYLNNGVRLGWLIAYGNPRASALESTELIEPSAKTVEIYRPNQQVEILNNPQTLSGENVLPGFVLDLSDVF